MNVGRRTAGSDGHAGRRRQRLVLADRFEPVHERLHARVVRSDVDRAQALVDVMTSEPGPADPLAENILFRLLDRLGVVPL